MEYFKRKGKELGSGSYGSVSAYTVTNKVGAKRLLKSTKKLPDTVAIKTINYATQSDDFLPRLRLEVESLQAVKKNRYLVEYFGLFFDTDKGKAYVVMELLPKGSYTTLTDMTTAPTTELLVELVKGMVCLHKAGLIHRDVKRSNIMWNARTKSLKYVDYGFTCFRESATSSRNCTSASMGTSGYRDLYGLRRFKETQDLNDLAFTDWWSLLVTMHKMLPSHTRGRVNLSTKDTVTPTRRSTQRNGGVMVKDLTRSMLLTPALERFLAAVATRSALDDVERLAAKVSHRGSSSRSRITSSKQVPLF